MIEAITAKEMMIVATCAEYMKELDVIVREAASAGKSFADVPDHMTRIRGDGHVVFINRYLQGELVSLGYSPIATKDRKISIHWA